MSLINCNVELSLKWYENCMLSNLFGDSTFTITDAKLYIPIVTLSAEDSAKLSKLLTAGFKRPIYWNKYKIIPNKTYDENDNIRKFQVIKELKDYLFLLIQVKVVLTELKLILTEDIFFQELR